MVSSTAEDLLIERYAINELVELNDFFEIVGSSPYNKNSLPSSSAFATREIAKYCDIYVLLLGNKFGYELKNGKSATEVEFESAYGADPTKILVFLKDLDDNEVEEKQRIFIRRVTDYYSGYWRTTFKNETELKDIFIDSLMVWIKERANLSGNLNYFDHFIRVAKQLQPEPTAQIFYKITPILIEIEYHSFGKIGIIHFNKEKVYNDFWGCVNSIEDFFLSWKQQ